MGNITGTYPGNSDMTETLTWCLGLFSGDRFPGESMNFKCQIFNGVEEVSAMANQRHIVQIYCWDGQVHCLKIF